MARRTLEHPEKVVLTLEGDFIPVSALAEGAKELGALLAAIDKEMRRGERPVLDWGIADLHGASATIEVAPRLPSDGAARTGRSVIEALVKGMAQLARSAERPPHWSDEALESSRRLAGMIGPDIRGVAVQGASGRRLSRPVKITGRVAANVNELIAEVLVSRGSVEGRVESATIHGAPHFTIYDIHTGRGVRCVSDVETVKRYAAALGKRVLAYGEVRVDRTGRPVSVKVIEHRVLRERSELPQPEELHGLYSKCPMVQEGEGDDGEED